ncbi:MAG: hypothetical protein AAF409_05740 [Pseudomonadota bacterium]
MIRNLVLAAAVAVLAVGSATADVTITFSSEGDDDFFDRCDIEAAPTGGRTVSVITYFVDAGDKGREICQQTRDGSACRESDELEYTCADVRDVELVGVTCRDNGMPVACGAVTAVSDNAMPVPVAVGPEAGGSDGALTIFGAILGYDDFFEHCEIGLSYAGPEMLDAVEIEHEITTPAGSATCTTNISGSGGTGRSCTGLDEYTCADVTGVRLTKITCESGDAEIDCGPVDIRAIGGDPITD